MWFQGRMEYGPRALGHRSVLARPDRPDAARPLEPGRSSGASGISRSVRACSRAKARACSTDWTGGRNRCMTMAYEVAACYRERLAGVISVDGTCRPQFVPDDDPGEFAELLREAAQRWGVGAVLNTSFNIHGEPLVCSPDEGDRRLPAIRCGRAGHRPVPGRAASLRPVRGEISSDADVVIAADERHRRVRWALDAACDRMGCGGRRSAHLALRLTPVEALRRAAEAGCSSGRSRSVCAWLWPQAVMFLRELGREARSRRQGADVGLGGPGARSRRCWSRRAPIASTTTSRSTRASAQNLADLKLAQMCNDGTVEYGRLQCWSGEYNKQPYAYPHVLSLAYRVFGVKEPVARVRQCRGDGADCLRGLSTGPGSLRGSHRCVLRRAAAGALARADHVVGDRCSGTVGLAGRGRGAARRRRSSAARGARGTCRCLRRVGLCGSVPAGVVPDPAGRRAAAVAARPRRVRAPAPLVGGASRVRRFSRSMPVTCSRSGTRGGGPARRGCRSITLRPTCGSTAGFYLGDARFPVAVTLLATIGLFDRPFRSARLAVGGYFVLFFVIVSAVLCRQL